MHFGGPSSEYQRRMAIIFLIAGSTSVVFLSYRKKSFKSSLKVHPSKNKHCGSDLQMYVWNQLRPNLGAHFIKWRLDSFSLEANFCSSIWNGIPVKPLILLFRKSVVYNYAY